MMWKKSDSTRRNGNQKSKFGYKAKDAGLDGNKKRELVAFFWMVGDLGGG